MKRVKKILTYGDLRSHTGTPGPRPILVCTGCGGEYSADAGDYWDRPASKHIQCGECGCAVKLVLKRTVYQETAK
jgi:hypothetical protein